MLLGAFLTFTVGFPLACLLSCRRPPAAPSPPMPTLDRPDTALGTVSSRHPAHTRHLPLRGPLPALPSPWLSSSTQRLLPARGGQLSRPLGGTHPARQLVWRMAAEPSWGCVCSVRAVCFPNTSSPTRCRWAAPSRVQGLCLSGPGGTAFPGAVSGPRGSHTHSARGPGVDGGWHHGLVAAAEGPLGRCPHI